jgi:hypothetical protein
MKFLVQQEVIQAVGNESVPPAEVVPDKQYGPAGRIHIALKPDIMKVPPETGP